MLPRWERSAAAASARCAAHIGAPRASSTRTSDAEDVERHDDPIAPGFAAGDGPMAGNSTRSGVGKAGDRLRRLREVRGEMCSFSSRCGLAKRRVVVLAVEKGHDADAELPSQEKVHS